MTTRYEERWSLRFICVNEVKIEPAINGCRQYECCLGRECGNSLDEVQAEIAAHYQRQADFYRDLSPEAFLEAQGYPLDTTPAPSPRKQGGE